MRDGRTLTRSRLVPVGAAGPDTRANHTEMMQRKFRSVGGPRQVADAVGSLHRMRPRGVRRWIQAAFLD
jgi:hypothetical protein